MNTMKGVSGSSHRILALTVFSLFILSHSTALAEAEAEADPEAQAFPDAEAEADPQMYGGGGYMPQQPLQPITPMLPQGGNNIYSPPPPAQTPCGMTNQCCGMSQMGCCQEGGQRCRTVWKRVCDTEDTSQCIMKQKQFCVDRNAPMCRTVTEKVVKQIASTICVPKPLYKCWTYEREECEPDQKIVPQKFEWENQRIVKGEIRTEEKCLDMTLTNCTDVEKTREITTQRQITLEEEKISKRCRTVPIVGPSTNRTVPVPRITYTEQCFDVPRTTCNTPMCTVGTCKPGYQTCNLGQSQTRTVCPLEQQALQQQGLQGQMGGQLGGIGGGAAAAVSGGCQQIQQPSCGMASGGSCAVGVQNCCRQETQRMCRRVPMRKIEYITQVMPGRVTYKQECEDVTIKVPKIKWEPQTKNITYTKKECTPYTEKKCQEVQIPEFKVETEQKQQMVTVRVPVCRKRLIKERYCHQFPIGNISCAPTMIPKQFEITKIICDRNGVQPFCTQIPYMDCRPGVQQKCRMEPKQECTNTCNNSPTCNQCEQFVSKGPGFGSCPTSTCGNFYPNENIFNNSMGSGVNIGGGGDSWGGMGGGVGGGWGSGIGGGGSYPGMGGGYPGNGGYLPNYPGYGNLGGGGSYGGPNNQDDLPPNYFGGGGSNIPDADYPQIGGGGDSGFPNYGDNEYDAGWGGIGGGGSWADGGNQVGGGGDNNGSPGSDGGYFDNLGGGGSNIGMAAEEEELGIES